MLLGDAEVLLDLTLRPLGDMEKGANAQALRLREARQPEHGPGDEK